MPKPIIDVQVRDDAFNDLVAAYNKFNEEVKKQPRAWAEIAKAAVPVGAALAVTEKVIEGHGTATEKVAKAQKAVNRELTTGRKTFEQLAKQSKSLADNVSSVTRNLLSWSRISGIFAGLVGGGSLFGLERLAHNTASASKSAQGLGVTMGEQRSFRINYNRYVESPDSLLQKVNEAKNDYTKLQYFRSLGIQGDVRNRDTQGLAMEVYRNARRVFAGSDHSRQFVESRGLDNFLSYEDLQRSGRFTDRDIGQSEQSTRRDNGALSVDNAVEAQWRSLGTALDRAEAKISTVLVQGLAPLAGPLGQIADKFADLIKTLLQNPLLREWLDKFAHSLEELDKFMGSPEFRADVTAFVEGIGRLARAIGEAYRWVIDHLPGGGGSVGRALGENTPGIPTAGGHFLPATPFVGDTTDTIPHRLAVGLGLSPDMPFLPGDLGTQSDRTADAAGVPRAFSRGIYREEGGLNADGTPRTSPRGALGVGQLMPDTAREMGVADPANMTTQQNMEASSRYMHKLIEQFHHNLEAAAAAYNAGPSGPGVRHFADTGDETQLPDETRKYLARLRRDGAFQRQIGASTTMLPGADRVPASAAAFATAAEHMGQNGAQVNDFLKANGQELDAARNNWCAAFVNASLKAVGIDGTNSNVASSFQRWGEHRAATDVEKGDILAKMNVQPGQVGGHVGFATGRTRTDEQGNLLIEMVSGNYAGKVSTSWERADQYDVRHQVQRATASTHPLDSASAQPSAPIPFQTAPNGGIQAALTRAIAQIKINVANNTGGNAHVTAGALAAV